MALTTVESLPKQRVDGRAKSLTTTLVEKVVRRVRRRVLGPLLIKNLVIVATRRTGSNFLCDCIRAFPHTLSLQEIYSRQASGLQRFKLVLKELGNKLGIDFANHMDPRRAEYFQRYPNESWRALAEIAAAHDRKLFSFKVFEDHLPIEVLGPLMVKRRAAVLFLVRNRLDAYISLRKAAASKLWSRTDTTGTQIEISAAEFLAWADKLDRWYGGMFEVAKRGRLRHIVLRYEDHIMVPQEEAFSLLRQALDSLGIRLGEPQPRDVPSYFKQDKNASPFDKVRNGAQIEAELTELGKLDYALDAPLSAEVWRASAVAHAR